jgi:hypothetical protein
MNQIVKGNLDETRKQLLTEISLLSFAQLNHTPDEFTWSVAKICHHLYLVEISFAKVIRYGLKQTDGKKIEPKPIQLISDRTKKIKAPEIVIPSGEQLDTPQIMNLLTESRTFLFVILDKIDDETILSERSAIHPHFGELPLTQWIELLYLHEQRHIEQIKDIKLLIQ